MSTLIAELRSTCMSRLGLVAVELVVSTITLWRAERKNYYGLLVPLGVSSVVLPARFLDFLLLFEKSC